MYIKKSSQFAPRAVLTNEMFEASLETSDEWIRKRTGITERRTALVEEPNRPIRFMAIEAVNALGLTEKEKKKIKHIIFASGLAEENYPNVANYIAKEFNINAPGLRVNSACSSFIAGLKFSSSLIEEGDVLLVSSESFTSIGDYSDKTSCVLLGDGSCAYLLSRDKTAYHIGDISLEGFGSDIINTGNPGESPEKTVLEFCKETLPLLGKSLGIRQSASRSSYGSFRQNGKEVYKTILIDIPKLLLKKISKLKLVKGELAFIGHQANLRMLEKIVEKTGLKKSQHFYNVDKYGNTGSSGCGMVLHDVIENENLHSGQKLLISAFGAGIVYGSAVVSRLK